MFPKKPVHAWAFLCRKLSEQEYAMIWLFDLDNTLHNASKEIFPRISANMNAFLCTHVEKDSGIPLSVDEANHLRLEYWKRFGATLLGVSRTLDSKARGFLEAAHRFDDLASLINAEKGLPAVLRKLPGRKVLLTNSAYAYSKNVLKLLGLDTCFDKHIAVESMRVFGRLAPKPSGKFFRKLPAMLRVRPQECILVEDNIRILKVARAVGMKTVLVTRYLETDRFSGHSSPYLSGKKQVGRPMYVNRKIFSVRHLARCSEQLC